MTITTDFVDLPTPSGRMRVHRSQPTQGVGHPAVILYSEIYQVTGPIQRLVARLAGEGYAVYAPEIYHVYELAGTMLSYDKTGTDRGNFLKYEKPLACYDSDTQTLLDWLGELPHAPQKVGTLGFCLGGHLAIRAALDPRVGAVASFYGTDLHTATLGQGKQDDTLARCGQIRADLLLIWGRQDPHIPAEGRRRIYDALTQSERVFEWHEFNAAHAFMRDEGPRYDAALSRVCWELVRQLFGRVL